MSNVCDYCKKPLKGFCIVNENEKLHSFCKIRLLNPDLSDSQLWDLVDPPGSPMPVPRNKPFQPP